MLFFYRSFILECKQKLFVGVTEILFATFHNSTIGTLRGIVTVISLIQIFLLWKRFRTWQGLHLFLLIYSNHNFRLTSFFLKHKNIWPQRLCWRVCVRNKLLPLLVFVWGSCMFVAEIVKVFGYNFLAHFVDKFFVWLNWFRSFNLTAHFSPFFNLVFVTCSETCLI